MWLVPMYIKQKKKARIQYAIFIQSVIESMVLTIQRITGKNIFSRSNKIAI